MMAAFDCGLSCGDWVCAWRVRVYGKIPMQIVVKKHKKGIWKTADLGAFERIQPTYG
jgi:hypothetical protein